MGVNLGAAGVTVPEQLLADAILHIALGQLGAVQVAQGVWVQLVGGYAGTQSEAANHGMQAAGGEAGGRYRSIRARYAPPKGVPFKVDETEGQFGRRNVLHQYPYRDLPFAEDLGREVRRFSVHAFVLTQPEYDALVEALECAG